MRSSIINLMVREIHVDPGKKPPFKPDVVLLANDLGGIHNLSFLQRALLEAERDPGKLIKIPGIESQPPVIVNVESLRALVTVLEVRAKEEASSAQQEPQKSRTESPHYVPPTDSELKSKGIQSPRVRELIRKWRGKTK